VCPPPPIPLSGCIPNGRPTIGEYGAQDLLDYFHAFSAPRLPGPYFYSDISTGLIGLILGSNPNAPMGDDAVQGWLDLLRRRIVGPLGMTDTFLFDEDAAPSQQARLAGGYNPPLVEATASGGGLVISGFTGGGGYVSAPAATVVGGGGSGAVVTTSIYPDGSIHTIDVKTAGQGYVAPAEVVFGGDVPTPAKGRAIISIGRVIGISILGRGEGYSPNHPPTVTLTGGTTGPGARTAILAPATVSNGGVDFVRVIDGGAGYVDPIAVIVAPGRPSDNAVPIWAPAGALKSTARDMSSFAQAALGQSVVNGVKLDPRLKSAFKMAQKGYACETPNQRPCLAMSGLAWSSTPADSGVPSVVSKNGGLAGFSTDLRLVPSLDLGVIVFINSNQRGEMADGKKPVSTSTLIADDIMYAIARANLR
jgi:CubicO group peptidase (beta-lactamase class C family)